MSHDLRFPPSQDLAGTPGGSVLPTDCHTRGNYKAGKVSWPSFPPPRLRQPPEKAAPGAGPERPEPQPQERPAAGG